MSHTRHPSFSSVYFNLSQGDGAPRGSWNSDENFEFVSDFTAAHSVDQGDGGPSVTLTTEESNAVQLMATRGTSDPDANPVTGAELDMDEMDRTVP